MYYLDDVVNKFISEKPNYFNPVNAFRDYCYGKGEIKEFLQGIRTESLIKALDDYINTRGVTSKTSARTYTFAIKDFLLFLFNYMPLENHELKMQLLLKTHEENSYRAQMNEHISNHTALSDTEGFEVFKEIETLISDCDDALDSKDVKKRAVKSKKYFNKYRSALIIKLILLIGIKYEELSVIESTDLDLKHSRLKVNGFYVQLPHNFHDQFDYYEKIVKEIDKASKRISLFVEFDMKPIKGGTATTSGFLKKLTSRGDINGIIKYRLVQLLQEGMNETYLKDLTGNGDTILDECRYIAFNQQSIQRHINSVILKTEMFDLL